jgi:AMIN domain
MLTPEFPTLRQVRISADYEAVVSFGLGLRDRVGFRVFGLTNPTRVVVDVAHQPRRPYGTAPVSGRGTAVNALVTGIRAGRHPGYERLVFDLAGAGIPMYGARYSASASTIRVQLCGLGSPASAPHGSYGGPRFLPIGLPELRSVSFTGSGAGCVGFLVATALRHGFRVTTLLNPSRVVLDVAQ